jgi:predicted peptidase
MARARTAAAFAISCVLVVFGRVSAETGFLDRALTIGGDSHQYQVYVPLDFSAAKTWPIIVDLHGGGFDGSDGLRQTLHGVAEQIRRKRSRFPVVAIFPQVAAGRRWEQPAMQELVMAEIDRTISEFHGDPKRVYLLGFSQGAMGACRIAYRWPDRFAALVSVAARIESRDTADGAADRQANPFVAARDPFSAFAQRLQSLPIRLFHGAADETFGVDQSRRLATALKAVGANVSYTEYVGASHVEAHDRAYAELDVDWLLEQHR